MNNCNFPTGKILTIRMDCSSKRIVGFLSRALLVRSTSDPLERTMLVNQGKPLKAEVDLRIRSRGEAFAMDMAMDMAFVIERKKKNYVNISAFEGAAVFCCWSCTWSILGLLTINEGKWLCFISESFSMFNFLNNKK
jgi:hypothetical protein